MTKELEHHFKPLDGLRGISIISVLACHLLPLGPSRWQLNATAGPLGMVLFFNLSGFLITTTLLKNPDARVFFIRRACRILPLACLFIPVALTLERAPPAAYLSHLLFFANYTRDLTPMTSPLWSLCVEVQFYVFIGILVLVGGRRAIYLLPLFCFAVTALRICEHVGISINTHLRVDEILAGGVIAILYSANLIGQPGCVLSRLPIWTVVLPLLISCHPASGPFNYLRPYLGALLLARAMSGVSAVSPLLESGFLSYFAAISYALYVLHPIMRYGWLGTGGGWERYLLKRPIGFLLVFVFAHLSSFYYEKWWISQGKRWSAQRDRISQHKLLHPAGAGQP